jgi:membrane-associated phospholipid phosphatase
MDWPGDRSDAAVPARWLSKWPERGLLALQIALLLTMTATVATKVWQDHVWVGFVIVAATVACWMPELTRPRSRRWWFAYVAGIFLYTLLRSYADETPIPIRTMYAIDGDRLMFLGTEPVVWLQEHLFSPSRISILDVFAVQVHWSFFIAPHLAAVIIFIWRRELFPRYTVLVVGTMYAGLLLFFVLPTTPPWLAARAGALPEAFRVMDFVGGHVDAATYRSFYQSLGEPNSVAAMPSIQMAVTFALYLWARDHHPRLAPWLLAYAIVMGFSLMYLAEHYATDLLAGVAVALLCHTLSRRVVAIPARE